MPIKIFIFDMDGVIFEGHNFWLDLHKKYGTEKEALDLAANYLASDYQHLSRYTVSRLWKDNDASDYYSMINERVYQDGIFELFDFLHVHGIKTAIISSGPYDLARRAQIELDIDEIRANRISIDSHNRISGDFEVMVPDSEKDRVGREVINQFGFDLEEAAFIGDTQSDISLARIVGLPIAYDSRSEALNYVSKLSLKKGEIIRIIDILEKKYIPHEFSHKYPLKKSRYFQEAELIK